MEHFVAGACATHNSLQVSVQVLGFGFCEKISRPALDLASFMVWVRLGGSFRIQGRGITDFVHDYEVQGLVFWRFLRITCKGLELGFFNL
jgi:hypothetical protein